MENAGTLNLAAVLKALSRESRFEDYFRKAAGAAASCCGADGAALIVRDGDTMQYRFFLGVPPAFSKRFMGYRYPVEQGVSGQVLRTGQSRFVGDYAHSSMAMEIFVAAGLRANLAVPVRWPDGEMAAVLAVSWFGSRTNLPDPEALETVEALAGLIGAALLREEMESRLRRQAMSDSLTGLPNRHALPEVLEGAMNRARRQERMLSVIVIDIDGFKAVNDRLGHHFGDLLLKSCADRLREIVRRGDTVVRMGGDEFLVLSEGIGRVSEVEALCRRIDLALRLRMTVEGRRVGVRPSIGVAMLMDDEGDADTLIHQADMAMYSAKADGGGYRFYGYEIDRHLQARRATREALESALQENRLALYLQPIVDLRDGRPVGAEALLRWVRADGTVLAPDSFLWAVHDDPLMEQIGRWVIVTGVALLRAWQCREALSGMTLALNVSDWELRKKGFCESLDQLTAGEHPIDYDRLHLEIVETAALSDRKEIVDVLSQCVARGISVYLDDFGTGHASLSHLSEMPVSGVKIDRRFVAQIDNVSQSRSLVQAIIGMAEPFGHAVVAEGIERPEQTEQLLGLGCRYGQGYLYGRPMPADAFCDWAAAQHAAREPGLA
ncbi:putative bifunctional diguanylate cyclase/phosphodiesterase [Acidihalobacter prosperus]|uniref:GGDEF domain-containing protein n=1 Tax=Acidihalobacter prosperus TaxID=160660 RepID=A0A1A6C1M8_9GAMM|nr:EAL domain-containing protein [Acidihalobacter prosperus]OBS08463.1 GGDEF domain-containing protein [Acidihalobacter prosperus]